MLINTMPFKSNSTPACLTALSGLLLTTAATPKRSSFHQCSDVTRWTTRGQRKNKIFRRCWAHFEAEKLRIEGKVDSKIAHIRLGDFWIKLCWKDVECGEFDHRGGIWWVVFPISKHLSNVTQRCSLQDIHVLLGLFSLPFYIYKCFTDNWYILLEIFKK